MKVKHLKREGENIMEWNCRINVYGNRLETVYAENLHDAEQIAEEDASLVDLQVDTECVLE